MRPKLKVRIPNHRWRAAGAICFLLLTALAVYWVLPFGAAAHGGVDDEPKPAAPPVAGQPVIPVVSAERNVQNDTGNFNFVLKRTPGDVRAGETEQFLIRIAETVEGGFGGGTPIALEKASVAASIIRADGTKAGDTQTIKPEANGNYRTAYAFGSSGDYKIVFAVKTEDGRSVSVDFPVTVTSAPVLWSFWLGFLVLAALTLAAFGAVFYKARRNKGRNIRKLIPLAAVTLLLFFVGFFVVSYFLPTRELRAAAELPLISGTESTTNALPGSVVLTIPKESQLLFGIKTEPVSTRQITSGLKTTGTVRALPNAHAVVSSPVSGKVILREGLSLGSAVGRGEQIGTIEQVLDVSTQSALEAQRLAIEAKKLEIKNSVLQLQAQQADQRAKTQQGRTRLAQAQRELRRSENLVEVGAVPRKRVEEAQTAVRVAEQEVSSAEQQVQLIAGQIKQTQAGQITFNSPGLNRTSIIFPLIAPVTGLIDEVKATTGQQLEAGKDVLSIVNLSTVLIEANVFERDLPVVRESTRASFTSAALNGEVYTIGTKDGDGRLVSIGQTVNEQTRTLPVIYEMKNPAGKLRDGMFVDITIDTSGERQVLAVLKKSVVTDQGHTFVYVFTGGESFEKRPVALGAEGSDYWEVKTGLKEGERVVTDGLYQLRSTQPGP